MTEPITLNIKVSFAWWLKPYFGALSLFAALHGMEIDQDKLNAVVRRATRVKATVK